MKKERLNYISRYIGKKFSGSPSPFAHWLAGELISAKKESVVFKFEVRREMTNPMGMLHGGVISAMIDDCMGVNFFILDVEYFYPSINLNVAFLRSAKEGENVIVKTLVIKQGKTIINLKAEVFDDNQKLLALATSALAESNYKIEFEPELILENTEKKSYKAD